MKRIYIFFEKINSLFEKVYWFLKRKSQGNSFKSIGERVTISRHCHFTSQTISIGNNVYVGQGCRFQATKSNIFIKNNVMFGPNVSVHGGNHRHDIIGKYMIDIKLDEKLPENDQDVIIEDDCWIGTGAIILKGVTIGEGSIIGAGSVINKSVAPYSIVVGSKQQQIFSRFSSEEIKIHKERLGGWK
jgi:acetyltransferase-like isoleucine patch superfamily enzyme